MKFLHAQLRPASSKPVLAIDFDDTLVEHAANVVDTYNRTHNGKIRLEDAYVAEKLGNPEHGWHHNRVEAMGWIREYMFTDQAQATPPAPGAVEALAQLGNHYDLVIVTGRAASWQGATEPWLDRFLPGVFSSVYYCGDELKSVVCKHAGAGIIIDDSPVYLADCIGAGITGVLYGDYTWSENGGPLPGVKRARTWAAAVELLA